MRKRSAYRPKAVIKNPIGYVMESVTPIRCDKNRILDLRIKNSQAMVALLQGYATKNDMDVLVALSNMCEALIDFGFGKEHKETSINGREALLKIIWRAVDKLKFIVTGQEIQALNKMMELHDAQMDVITLKDLEKAIHYVNKKVLSQDGITLPNVNVSKKNIHQVEAIT